MLDAAAGSSTDSKVGSGGHDRSSGALRRPRVQRVGDRSVRGVPRRSGGFPALPGLFLPTRVSRSRRSPAVSCRSVAPQEQRSIRVVGGGEPAAGPGQAGHRGGGHQATVLGLPRGVGAVAGVADGRFPVVAGRATRPTPRPAARAPKSGTPTYCDPDPPPSAGTHLLGTPQSRRNAPDRRRSAALGCAVRFASYLQPLSPELRILQPRTCLSTQTIAAGWHLPAPAHLVVLGQFAAIWSMHTAIASMSGAFWPGATSTP